MKIKLILITIACAITSCSSSQAQPNSETTNTQLISELPASATMVAPVPAAVAASRADVLSANRVVAATDHGLRRAQVATRA